MSSPYPAECNEHRLFPAAYWELFELVLDGCPEPAVKEHRKSVIGRKSLLRARGADHAIRAGINATGLGTKEFPTKLLCLTDGVHAKVRRNRWYRQNGWPCVFVRRAGDDWPEAFKRFMASPLLKGWPVNLLEYDDEHVDRIAG